MNDTVKYTGQCDKCTTKDTFSYTPRNGQAVLSTFKGKCQICGFSLIYQLVEVKE